MDIGEGGTLMPFISQRPKLELSAKEIEDLTKISRSRTESYSRIERARMILCYSLLL